MSHIPDSFNFHRSDFIQLTVENWCLLKRNPEESSKGIQTLTMTKTNIFLNSLNENINCIFSRENKQDDFFRVHVPADHGIFAGFR